MYHGTGFIYFQSRSSTNVMGLVVSGCVLVIKEDIWGHRNILSKCHVGDFFGESYAAGSGAVLNISVTAVGRLSLY